jgi:hypothetical protein
MNGSQTVKMSFTVDKKEACCRPTVTPLCRYPDNDYEFHYEKDEEDKSLTHNVYNFLVEINGSVMDSIDYTNGSPTAGNNVFTTVVNETSFEEVEKTQRYVIGRYRTLKGNAVDTFKTTLRIKRVQQTQTQVLTLHIPMSDCNGKDSSKTEKRIMPLQQGTQQEKLRIFPNPVSSGATQVNIVHSAIAFNRKYKVNIFSSIGMKINEQIETGNTEGAIVLHNIPALKQSGLFLISIEDENGTFISRGMFVVAEK